MSSCSDLGTGNNQNRWKPVALCLAGLLINAVLASPLAGQSNEAATSGAQEPPPAAQPQAAQPATEPAKPKSTQAAQPQGSQTRTPHAMHRRPAIDDRVKALAASLNLTEEQQASVKNILMQRQAEILRLRNSPMAGDERIGRLRLLQDQTVEKIRSVLNDEQKTKYDPLAVRKVPPSSDQKTLEDWLKATSPH